MAEVVPQEDNTPYQFKIEWWGGREDKLESASPHNGLLPDACA